MKARKAFLGFTVLNVYNCCGSEAERNMIARAVMDYLSFGVEPSEADIPALMWRAMKAELESSPSEKKSESSRENGKKGGRPRKHPEPDPNSDGEENNDEPEMAKSANSVSSVSKTQETHVGFKTQETHVGFKTQETHPFRAETETKTETGTVSCVSPSRAPAHTREETPPPAVPDAPPPSDGIDERCPVPPERLELAKRNLGLTDADIREWSAYYGAMGWRFKPQSREPMSAQDGWQSLRNWSNSKATFAARDKARAGMPRGAPPNRAGGIAAFHDPEGAARTAAAVGLL